MKWGLMLSHKGRYLIAGAWNTLFGYTLGATLFLYLSPSLHTAIIGIISNCVAISMSFYVYKIFVFRTNGNWLNEYLKAWIVYGNMAIISVILLWIFVDFCNFNIWISQVFIVLITVVISYFGHKKFTFKKR